MPKPRSNSGPAELLQAAISECNDQNINQASSLLVRNNAILSSIRKSLGTQLSIESNGSIDNTNGALVYSHATKIWINDNRKEVVLAASTISDTAENLILLAEELNLSKIPSIIAEYISKTNALGQLGIKQATLFEDETNTEPAENHSVNSNPATEKQEQAPIVEEASIQPANQIEDSTTEVQTIAADASDTTEEQDSSPQVEVVEDIDSNNASNSSLEIAQDNNDSSEPLISASYVGNILELMRTLNLSSKGVLSYVRRDIDSINDLYMKEAYSVSSRLRSAVNGNKKAVEIVNQRREEFGAFSPAEVNGNASEDSKETNSSPKESSNNESSPKLDKESENRRTLLINQIEKHSGNKVFVKALLATMKKNGYYANTAEGAIQSIKKVDDSETIMKLQSAIGLAAMQSI